MIMKRTNQNKTMIESKSRRRNRLKAYTPFTNNLKITLTLTLTLGHFPCVWTSGLLGLDNLTHPSAYQNKPEVQSSNTQEMA